MKGKMKSASLFLLALVLCSCATTREVTQQEAIEIARKQLVTARPDLKVMEAIPDDCIISLTYSSDGVPHMVKMIGFEATDRTVEKKCVYYVTVFPNGKTGEIRISPTCNVTSHDIGRRCKITEILTIEAHSGSPLEPGMITHVKRGQTWYTEYVGILFEVTDTYLRVKVPYPDRPNHPAAYTAAGVSRKNVVAFEFLDKQ